MGPIRNNKHKVVEKKWVDKDVERALNNAAAGISIRKAVKTHGTAEGALRRRINMKERGEALTYWVWAYTISTPEGFKMNIF